MSTNRILSHLALLIASASFLVSACGCQYKNAQADTLSIRGFVLLPNGTAVQSARVVLETKDHENSIAAAKSSTAVTNDHGEFLVQSSFGCDGVTISALASLAPGYEQLDRGLPAKALTEPSPDAEVWAGTGTTDSKSDPIVIVLSRVDIVSGRVVVPSGKHIKAFTILISPTGENSAWNFEEIIKKRFKSDGGDFVVEHVQPGRRLVTAVSTGFARATPLFINIPGSIGKLSLELQIPIEIRGRVLDEKDMPMNNVWVGARYEIEVHADSASFQHAVYSRPDGSFAIGLVYPESCLLEAVDSKSGRKASLSVHPMQGENITDLVLRMRSLGF